MIAALQRPRECNKGALRRHAPRQVANRLRGYAADGGRPVGVFRRTVLLAREIGRETIEANAVFFEEGLIVQAFVERSRGVEIRSWVDEATLTQTGDSSSGMTP